ncbi:MAG: hypothetical protein CVV60_05975 [Tenericutes bacterium HGW-Tenericutes-5]|nr:MAG: hypothetical protein CVV60_05975 [Tenericutes bacterium HGW-Tenericutes-5]
MKRLFKLSVIMLLAILITACDKTTTESSYLDVDYSDFVGQFIEEVEEQLDMPSDDYYVYYYGPGCSACIEIKPEVLDRFYRAKNTTIYFVTVYNELDLNPDTGVTATPTVIRVVNGQVAEFYEGVSEIRSILNQIT